MALTIKNPASDLATALAGQTLASVLLEIDNNLFFRDVHPLPMGLVILLRNSGGPAPRPYLSPTPSAFFTPSVQCLVYGHPGADGYDAAEALARAVIGYLHQATVSGYVAIFARDSQPAHLGPESETQRERFSINFEAQYVA